MATSRSTEQQRSRQLIEAPENKRRTLARELHDEMEQTLTAISVTAAFLEPNAVPVDAKQPATAWET